MILAPLLLASVASAIPDAPQPHVDRTEYTLLAVDFTMRMIDAKSTRDSLEHGGQEHVLPHCIAGNDPTMYLYSASVVAFNFLLIRELERHHHHKLARLAPMVDIAVEAPVMPGVPSMYSQSKHHSINRIGK